MSMNSIFFGDWSTLLRTAIIGISAYASMVLFLRVSGRRTLSKMNAFDLVVTVSLGSTLATVLLNRNVTLAQGALAFALLIGMQFAVTWSSVRISWIRKMVTGEPALLYYQDKFLTTALRRARVTEDEIRAAIRSTGLKTVDETEAVVLETDGSFSVIQKGGGSGRPSLEGVKIPE